MNIEDLIELLKSNPKTNFIGMAITPLQITGIDAAVLYLQKENYGGLHSGLYPFDGARSAVCHDRDDTLRNHGASVQCVPWSHASDPCGDRPCGRADYSGSPLLHL